VLSVSAFGQSNISATAGGPRQVQTGAQFAVEFAVNVRPESIQPPDFKGFAVVGGPMVSSSRNISIVNGRMQEEASYTYTYYLQGLRAGVFPVGAATFSIQGKSYATNTLSIEVVQGPSSPASGSTPARPQAQSAAPAATGQKIFLRTLLDKTTVYQGEPISATIKLYSSTQISQTTDATFPPFDGFYAHEVKIPLPDHLDPEEVDGATYGSAVIRKYTLFPQKSGKIVIAAPSMKVVVPQRIAPSASSFWDDFFGSSVQPVEMDVPGTSRTVQVLPLPEGKPESFTGAVGTFTIKATLDKLQARTNDALTFVLTVSGSGNLRLIEAPAVSFPPDFEVYDPKTTVQAGATDVSGYKTFEYLIIPRHSGSYSIPGVAFSYFDPTARQYKTLLSEGFTLDIAKGEDQGTGPAVVRGVDREDVRFLGKDIRYIKTVKYAASRGENLFFGSIAFWLWYLIPALLSGAALWWRRRYIRIYSDQTLRKHLHASKFAARRLKKARSFLDANQRESFLEELSRALWGYLGDKLNIPVSELSRDAAMQALRERGVSEEAVMEWVVLIDTAEFARYAPAVAGQDLPQVYDRAVSLISRIQKELTK